MYTNILKARGDYYKEKGIEKKPAVEKKEELLN